MADEQNQRASDAGVEKTPDGEEIADLEVTDEVQDAVTGGDQPFGPVVPSAPRVQD